MTSERTHELLTGTARGFGGAILFAMPLLMTMEMWELGMHIEPSRLLLFTLLGLPLLVALSHYSGFEDTAYWRDDLRDGITAYAIGAVVSLVLLYLFGAIGTQATIRASTMSVAIQAIPAAFGAVLANSQLRGADGGKRSEQEDKRRDRATYAGEILFMVTGALFLAFNLAPTEEMVLISYRITPALCLALLFLSLGLSHAFVYALDFPGQHNVAEGIPWWSIVLRFTVVGYAVSLLVAAYILWTFGRFDGASASVMVRDSLVLAFPASIGAAAARLVL